MDTLSLTLASNLTHSKCKSVSLQTRNSVPCKLSELSSTQRPSPPHSSMKSLGFLSHCCQIVPLGRQFLRNVFALLHRTEKSTRIHISQAAKKDLRWWLTFLSSWSTITIIQSSRVNYDVAIDASGLKGIGGIYNSQIFSQRVPSCHRSETHRLQRDVCNPTCFHLMTRSMDQWQSMSSMRQLRGR